MSRSSNKHNARLYLGLVIILVTLTCCNGNETEVLSDSQISDQISPVGKAERINERLLQIRRVMRSLFFDWNLGESGLEGAVARTFGRIRMMRNLFLPAAFMGGFLTAVIFKIAITGFINKVLITGVLMLQFAGVIGKLLYGLKELFGKDHSHHHPEVYYQAPQIATPIFIPHSGGSSSYGSSYASRSGDDFGFYPHPNFNSQQSYYGPPQPHYTPPQPQYNPQYSQQSHYSQPQINQLPNSYLPQQSISSSYSGIALQQPQPTYLQPVEVGALSNRIDENPSVPTTAALTQPQPSSSLSPHQMTQLLADALAKVSQSAPNPNAFRNRSNEPNQFHYNRS